MCETYATSRETYLQQYVQKHWEQTFATYVYNHCNIPIYLATSIWNTCNIPLKYLKHLKHTLATCIFSTSQHLLPTWENEGSSGVEFAGARMQQPSGSAVAQCGSEASTTRRAWQGQQPSTVTRRRPRAETGEGSHTLHLVGLVVERHVREWFFQKRTNR
jgi:hypothetical protein